ncbi:hypothetical protein EKO23_16320 [Nocardioides guangzhouensis]|uniref:Uncharacterized protein n=1 Tax=Nocardioides guangzhouensis TaxID=2497878 RepID=A0A4Q4Z9S1_9ACTN|nr:hypothetical protein [Nocardioides guangzhouensis]RYP84225.1 hypothetical protein EKO23_16320 [Nocardioides guangzhouensis]
MKVCPSGDGELVGKSKWILAGCAAAVFVALLIADASKPGDPDPNNGASGTPSPYGQDVADAETQMRCAAARQIPPLEAEALVRALETYVIEHGTGSSLDLLDACPKVALRMMRAQERLLAAQKASRALKEQKSPEPAPPDPEQGALNAKAVRLFGAVADDTGYGYGEGTTLGFGEAKDLALLMLSHCEDVAGGVTTWEDLVDEDVSVGASPADAREMYGYVREYLCP